MSSLESLVGSMTVAELARFANTSVERVVSLAFAGTTATVATPRGAPPGKPTRKATTRAKRAPRGSITLDKVLAVVGAAKGPVDAQAIRSKIGGSAAQVRAALKRLAGSGKIKITGTRRGTRYAAK